MYARAATCFECASWTHFIVISFLLLLSLSLAKFDSLEIPRGKRAIINKALGNAADNSPHKFNPLSFSFSFSPHLTNKHHQHKNLQIINKENCPRLLLINLNQFFWQKASNLSACKKRHENISIKKKHFLHSLRAVT